MFSGSTRIRQQLAVGSLTVFLAWMLMLGNVFIVRAGGEEDKTLLKRAEKALRKGLTEDAEKIYAEMLQTDARDINALVGLAYLKYKRRDLSGAFETAVAALKVDKNSARAHAIAGMVLLSAGNFEVAQRELILAYNLDNKEPLANAGVGLIHYYENRLPESVASLWRAYQLDSKEADFIYYYAQASARNEQYREAAAAFRRFLDIAPPNDEDRRARIKGLIDFLEYLGAQDALYVLEGEKEGVVNFELPSMRPLLPVRVNGRKETLGFVLDTGSGMSVISQETAQRLGVKPIARGGMARAIGGGGKFEIVYGFIRKMQIGKITVRNVPVYIRRFHGDATSAADGYLGLSVINKYRITVDYMKREFGLKLINENETPVAAPQVVALNSAQISIPIRTTASGFLSGEVRLEGLAQPQNFIIDTGASISVLSDHLIERENLDEKLPEGNKMRIFGAAGVTENVSTYILPRVGIGIASQPSVTAAVLNLESVNETTGFEQTGILGGNFLRSYRITFDFKRGLMHLQNASGEPFQMEAGGTIAPH